MTQKLTVKQQRFVDFFDGNATDAARKAGYKQATAQGHENLRKPNIIAALEKREKKRNQKGIMTVEEIQVKWSEIIKTGILNGFDTKDVMKAMQDLTKSHGGFIDKSEITHGGNININLNRRIIDSRKALK